MACQELTPNENFKVDSRPHSKIRDSLETSSPLVPIVLTERGGCSFVTKSRNIQRAGGQIALIINHMQDYQNIHSVSDDGTGEDISLTTILIPEEEGEIIKSHIKKNPSQDLILEINHQFEDKTKTSDIRVFFSPSDAKVYKLLSSLNNVDINFLITHTNFNPIYAFRLNEESEKSPNYKNFLFEKGKCLCGTKYCEDYEISKGSTGRDILKEAVRQKCLYLITANNNQPHKYFDYMKNYYSECVVKNTYTDECASRSLQSLDDEFFSLKKRLDQCFIMSFNNPDKIYSHTDDIFTKCKTNIHLEEASHYLSNLMRKALPLISINDSLFYGQWNKERVVKAVCSSIKNSKEINYCNTWDI